MKKVAESTPFIRIKEGHICTIMFWKVLAVGQKASHAETVSHVLILVSVFGQLPVSVKSFQS